MGGMGKTTLAQLVYKDELVKKLFEPLMWVHVSEIFDIEIILVNIMESITETKFHKPSNFHVLVKLVQQQLDGKKYLLVLDDLWNEDPEQWGCLMSVLLDGAPGSKILITTRNNQVASIVRGSIPPHNLSQLEDDACWSIIKKKAFSPGGALNAQRMSDLGKEIAKKSCGLPLAAKFLGGLMHLKNKESDWISIRDDDIWNTPESKRKILPVIKLSYNHLASHLKQCFSYCSIFPKNWEISKETLVHLWMAEGFLKQSNTRNKKSIEDFGRDYFESLAWSSFFQNFKNNELGDIETCKMHDLVHDLAQVVLGENELVSLKVKVSESTDVSEARRLQLDLEEDILVTFLKNLSDAKKLRALFIPKGSNLDLSILLGNKHLRILHVGPSPKHSFPESPSLSFKLRHLRYLHLSFLDLREMVNYQSSSINKLYNLETLVLTNMYGVQNLLTNIQCSQKLRYLEISWTDMEELPDSVTSLSNLQTLDLKHSDIKVIPDSISGLKNLRFLNLSFNDIEELPISIITLSNLETLDVNTCRNLKSLPECVAGLSNLRIFDFKNCPLLETLPEDFGALTQLRCFRLDGTSIKVLPESCANLNNVEFVSLLQCELPKDVGNWTNLRKFHIGVRGNPIILGMGKLVCLEVLTYWVPKKLINEPERNVGIEELANLNSLEMLSIANLQNVKDLIDAERANLKGKHNLRALYLFWDWKDLVEELGMMGLEHKSCNDLRLLEALQPPTSLKWLGIDKFVGCDFPKWMSGLPNLDKLSLHNCVRIEQLPAVIKQLPRLKHLVLIGLPLKSLDIGGFSYLRYLELTEMFLLEELSYSYPPSLQHLRISGCKSLTEIPSFPSLMILILQKIDCKLVCSVWRSQTSLTTLVLENIEELIYFPISLIRNNCNLQFLQIHKCSQFQGIHDEDEKVLALNGLKLCSVSLQELELTECPVLELLSDLQGCTSLLEYISRIYTC